MTASNLFFYLQAARAAGFKTLDELGALPIQTIAEVIAYHMTTIEIEEFQSQQGD